MTAKMKTNTARACEGSSSSWPNVSFNNFPPSVEQSTWVVGPWNFACRFVLKCIWNWFCFFRLWKAILQINWFLQHQPSTQLQPLQWSNNYSLSTVAYVSWSVVICFENVTEIVSIKAVEHPGIVKISMSLRSGQSFMVVSSSLISSTISTSSPHWFSASYFLPTLLANCC